MTFVRFLHLAGIGVWLGAGALALLLVRMAAADVPARRADRLELAGRFYAWLVGPAAILATASGLAITMMGANAGYGARLGEPASAGMQGLGLLAGALEIFGSFPASQRMLRSVVAADPAHLAGSGERQRRRIALLSPVTLLFVVVALYLGVVATPHG